MLSISSICHNFQFGEGKSAKTLQIANYGLGGMDWMIILIGKGGTARELCTLQLNTELGVQLTPGKAGKIDIPTLFRSIADVSCHNLPSIVNPAPENQGSILLAVAFEVARQLKGSENGARINANCAPLPAIKEDWIAAYLKLETMFNFPIYCRQQFVSILRTANMFIEFPNTPITDLPPVETPMERAKKCSSTEELERISKNDLQAIALTLEVDSNGSKAELAKRISAALNPVVA